MGELKYRKAKKSSLFQGIKVLILISFVLLPSTSCATDAERTEPVSSNSITLSPDGKRLYTANHDTNSVSVVDVLERRVLQEIPVGREPRALTLSPDGRVLYVACRYDHRIDVIDTRRWVVKDSIPTGLEPMGILTSTDGKLLYVGNYNSSTVDIVDLSEKQVLKRISVEEWPRGLTLSGNGKELYVAHYLSAKVSVIDTMTQQVEKVIPISVSPDLEDPKKSQGIANTAEQLRISPDGKEAWLVHLLTNVDTPIQFDETIFPAVSVIDLEKGEENREARKELFDEINVLDNQNQTIIVANPTDVVFLPEGQKAFVLMGGSQDLVVFDRVRGGNATQILRLPGDYPSGMAISSDGKTIYVHHAVSHELSFVETGGSDSYADAQVNGENLSLIRQDPLPPLVREGKKIFFSANSEAFAASITQDNWMSCASCHSDGFTDGLTLMTPKGPRNVPSNALAMHTGLFMWDGSRDDLEDYVLTVQTEMGGLTQFDPARPLPPEVAHMFDALEAYLSYPFSLPVPQSPYKHPNGRLSPVVQAGERLFYGKAGCSSCHKGEYYTDSAEAVDEQGKLSTSNRTNLYNVGTANPLDKPSEGDPRALYSNSRDVGEFDVPTLRGVWATAPYLHDGSAQTLKDVIISNDKDKHGKTSSLSEKEINALVEYLKSLD